MSRNNDNNVYYGSQRLPSIEENVFLDDFSSAWAREVDGFLNAEKTFEAIVGLATNVLEESNKGKTALRSRFSATNDTKARWITV